MLIYPLLPAAALWAARRCDASVLEEGVLECVVLRWIPLPHVVMELMPDLPPEEGEAPGVEDPDEAPAPEGIRVAAPPQPQLHRRGTAVVSAAPRRVVGPQQCRPVHTEGLGLGLGLGLGIGIGIGIGRGRGLAAAAAAVDAGQEE